MRAPSPAPRRRVMGYKTERGQGGLMNVTEGSTLEVLGTFAYTTGKSGSGAPCVLSTRLRTSAHCAPCRPHARQARAIRSWSRRSPVTTPPSACRCGSTTRTAALSPPSSRTAAVARRLPFPPTSPSLASSPATTTPSAPTRHPPPGSPSTAALPPQLRSRTMCGAGVWLFPAVAMERDALSTPHGARAVEARCRIPGGSGHTSEQGDRGAR